jgi:hypothetical protein
LFSLTTLAYVLVVGNASDSCALHGSQLEFAKGLECWQLEHFELFFRADDYLVAMLHGCRIVSIVSGSQCVMIGQRIATRIVFGQRDAILIDHLDMDDGRTMLQPHFLCQYARDELIGTMLFVGHLQCIYIDDARVGANPHGIRQYRV